MLKKSSILSQIRYGRIDLELRYNTFVTVSSTWGNGNNFTKEQMLARTIMVTMPVP